MDPPSSGMDKSTISSDEQRQHHARPYDHPSNSRFIGDLNPEASLVAEHDPGSGNRDRHDVGIWVGRHTYDARHDQDHRKRESVDANSPEREGLVGGEEQAPPSALMNTHDRDSLVDIYFARLNPLLPIVDEATFRNTERKSQLVIHAMCLVASRDQKARRYLRFLESPEPLTPRAFASRVYAALRWGVQLGRERDKINLIQILALMSLYSEGPEGTVDASMHLSQAIHHGQTIGLHLGRSSGHGGSQTRLFWALWVLSNFNAGLNGRPRQILDLDIGLKLDEAYEISAPGTRILLAISQLLTRIIGLYQPTAALDIMGIEEDYESFENILDRCGAWDLEPNVITSLEIYYHGVAIISHRARATSRPLLPTPSSLRQELSALQIVTILRHISPKTLVPLPLIPYGISLAVSTFYNQLRSARSHIKRIAAREHIDSCVQALEQLSEWSQPAKNMAMLGRKALDQTAQVAAATVSPELRRTSRIHAGPAEWRPTGPPHHQIDQAGMQQNNASASLAGQQPQPDDGLSGFNIAYDELMDMDAVFGDFLNMNLPDFGLPFQ
ncbi:hypothetical protein QM012_007868 [Aureobasidium pullulans]|uniref:Xylanolytic transcriptional activator regulatory domain-containing protein n=1 Tax=Aureobasidium pullulans TaxID=5580 RepID=A0ABR0TKW0_AURPU